MTAKQRKAVSGETGQSVRGNQTPARWRELLGDELADRVAAMAAANGRRPATLCVSAVREVIERYEAAARRGGVPGVTPEQARCKHPDNRRSVNGRCGACGLRGLPGRAA